MAKKANKKKWGFVKDPSVFYKERGITNVNIGDYNRANMQVYGINVVMSRHIPLILDGLKPGERRGIYMMYRTGKGSKIKMSTAITETMKIHPHGDNSIYDTMIIMGQPWKNMFPYIDNMGQNYGCADSHSSQPAAYRYLDVKLSKYARDCFFSDFDSQIVEMRASYDGSLEEPLYLPSKYPNLFLNGASGMAFGWACAIPTYNVRDLFNYTIELIKNPDYDGVIIPDTPTPCEIVDEPEVFESLLKVGYHSTGSSKKEDRTATYKIRSIIDIDEDAHTLTVRSFPPQCGAEAFVKGIAEMKKNDDLTGCTAIYNNSQGDTVEIILVFKPETDLHTVRESLYSTKLSTVKFFAAQVVVIDDFSIVKYSVKECLLDWINLRREYKRRYYNMKIVTSMARIHELEILLFLFNGKNAEKTIGILKNSEDSDDIIRNLIAEYGIDSIKARAVCNMRNSEYSKKARKNFETEKEKLENALEKYMKKVVNQKKLDKEIIEELEDGIDKYGEPRRSTLVKLKKPGEVVDKSKWVLVISEQGYVKKMAEGTRDIGNLPQGDSPMAYLKVNNTEALLVFDSEGKVHTIRVSSIKPCSLSDNGQPLTTYSAINTARLMTVYVVDAEWNLRHSSFKNNGEGAFFLFTTRNGMMKKTAYSAYTNLRSTATAINIREGDTLVSVRFISEDKDVVIFTDDGLGMRFNSSEISETKRATIGVTAVALSDGDSPIQGSIVIEPEDRYLFILSSKGYGKKIYLNTLESEKRRAALRPLIKLKGNDHLRFVRSCLNDDTYVATMVGHFEEFDVYNVPERYRLQEGVKILSVPRGDKIIQLTKKPSK